MQQVATSMSNANNRRQNGSTRPQIWQRNMTGIHHTDTHNQGSVCRGLHSSPSSILLLLSLLMLHFHQFRSEKCFRRTLPEYWSTQERVYVLASCFPARVILETSWTEPQRTPGTPPPPSPSGTGSRQTWPCTCTAGLFYLGSPAPCCPQSDWSSCSYF